MRKYIEMNACARRRIVIGMVPNLVGITQESKSSERPIASSSVRDTRASATDQLLALRATTIGRHSQGAGLIQRECEDVGHLVDGLRGR
jgi:hypothetical protein